MSDPIHIASIETGICPPGFSDVSPRFEVQTTLREQTTKWFLDPLSKLTSDEAFIAMIISIVLLEKWLRVSREHGEETFSETSKAIRDFAGVFNLQPRDAFYFWQDWRNGLLHRGMPKFDWIDGYFMSSKYPEAVAVENKVVRVNPWLFRDKVLELVRTDRKMWSDPMCPLAKVIRVEDTL